MGPRAEANEGVVGEEEEFVGRTVDLRLVALQPHDLGDRVHRVQARACDRVDSRGAEALAEGSGLLRAARVDVEDRIAQGRAVRPDSDRGLAEGGYADRLHGIRFRGRLRRAGDDLLDGAPHELRVDLLHAGAEESTKSIPCRPGRRRGLRRLPRSPCSPRFLCLFRGRSCPPPHRYQRSR